MNRIYIGIDPDLRLLNAVIMSDQKKILAICVRRNKGTKGDAAVSNTARHACRLIEDVIAFFITSTDITNYETVLVIESQNMMHTRKSREQGKKINYEHIKELAQVTGCLMGAFSNCSSRICLVQPMEWKKGVPKGIHHGRIYKELGLKYFIKGGKEPYGIPDILNNKDIFRFSHDKVNPGDFKDISDSIGLALYGVKKGL